MPEVYYRGGMDERAQNFSGRLLRNFGCQGDAALFIWRSGALYRAARIDSESLVSGYYMGCPTISEALSSHFGTGIPGVVAFLRHCVRSCSRGIEEQGSAARGY